MKKHSRLLFFFIIALTLVTLFITLPHELTIPKNTPILNNAQPISYKLPNPLQVGPVSIPTAFPFKKGLDLEGGTSITLRANMSEVSADRRDDALESAKEVIERRINFYGVSEPVIQTARTNNDYRIIVEIPGITDVNQAVNLIGTTAKLTFWEDTTSTPGQIASPSATLPLGVPELVGPNAKQTNLSGSDLKDASVTFDPSSGQPQIQLTFTSEGAQKFSEITGRNIGRVVGMVLDNQIIQSPVVNERIIGGTAVITGGFTTEQAKAVAVQLDAGALPVSLTVLEQYAIGATLGNESIQKSLIAGIIGFLVIVIFMTVLYGRLGVLASFALSVYVLIMLSLFKLIPVTLTLAGIAGFILSIGIAVDANILIFDRTIEELRRGRSREAALAVGFQRAWTSIRDSNVASLITSAILYYFGTGIVRGFALTLAVGVLISMFSAITVTQTLLNVFYKNDVIRPEQKARKAKL